MFPYDSRDVQPARRRSRSHVLRSPADRLGGLRLGKRQGAARVSVHREAAGTVQVQERSNGLRVDRRQVRVGVRARAHRSTPNAIRRSPTRCGRRRSPRTRSARNIPASARPRPGDAPYFYEEDNWVDDMELGAAELYALTRDRKLPARRARLRRAGAGDAVDGRGHRAALPVVSRGTTTATTRSGATRDARRPQRSSPSTIARDSSASSQRADNGFRVGIPFIWCSNNLMASFATQA